MHRVSISTLISALAILFAAAVQPATAASNVTLSMDLTHPVVYTGSDETIYLRVGVEGHSDKEQIDDTPVNVALVIDRSGSMNGEKIDHARKAALMFLERLDSNDILSVITYNQTVDVVIPATRISDREDLRNRIRSITASGNTALFAGVSKGAAEVRKFLSTGTVNRIILLSDGLANEGPSSPDELGLLGASLAKEGISVSTIGLGLDYNEDLMYRLAAESSGFNTFAETPKDLAKFFDREAKSLKRVIARDLHIDVRIAEGIRPVRVLGHEGVVDGQTASFDLVQLYRDDEAFVIVELEVPEGMSGENVAIATGRVTWTDLETRHTTTASSTVSVSYTPSRNLALARINKSALADAVRFRARSENTEAMALRDQGLKKEAAKKLEELGRYIEYNNDFIQSPDLGKEAGYYYSNQDRLLENDDEDWKAQRKGMSQSDFQVFNY